MKIKALLGLENPFEEAAFSLYGSIVAQARQTYFYSDLKVKDTVEGRFDMIIIHAFLLFHRLKNEDENARQLSQTVFDTMFKDLDQSLREMGVGDMGIGRRIKKMASSFYGRVSVYDKALEAEDNGELEQVIARNVFNKSHPDALVLKQLGSYMRTNVEKLKLTSLDGLLSGKISFVNPEKSS
jgi:cytochrome b pre-mRNA-processing protein 3